MYNGLLPCSINGLFKEKKKTFQQDKITLAKLFEKFSNILGINSSKSEYKELLLIIFCLEKKL